MSYYEIFTKQTLTDLGVRKLYRGSEYITSSMCYIAENEDCFTPITKILYPEVAKIHKTSREGVESGIRDIIDHIWSNDSNQDLRNLIFHDYEKKPTNSEFLIMLYNYVNHRVKAKFDKPTYICPVTGTYCNFSNEILTKMFS